MLEIWDFFKNILILFSLFGVTMFGLVSKAYSVIKTRVDINQSIKLDSMRPNRLWYWIGFGFVAAYILFLLSTGAAFSLGAFTQVFSQNDDAENMIITLLSDLPIVAGAMVVGYIYGRKIFKK